MKRCLRRSPNLACYVAQHNGLILERAEENRQREINDLQRKAEALGLQLSPSAANVLVSPRKGRFWQSLTHAAPARILFGRRKVEVCASSLTAPPHATNQHATPGFPGHPKGSFWKGVYVTLIVTHNRGQAGRVSRHSAFMLNGQLVELWPTQDVFKRPSDPRTAEYVAGRYGWLFGLRSINSGSVQYLQN